MKFLSVGLFTLSSLFAATSAAPAPLASVVPTLPGNVKSTTTEITTTTDSVVYSKLSTVLVEVKKHTSTINATIVSIDINISKEDKTSVIQLVQTEITAIVGLIGTLTGEILGLVGETLEKVEQEKILSIVLELILEILCTLKSVIAVLKISIFELLGNLIFSLLTVIGYLLTLLNIIIDGLLKLVFASLTDIIALLNVVLSGLLPLVFGIVGGLLGKVGGLLSCLL